MSDAFCQLCEKGEGLYVCPRCSVLYCSVACYKSEKHLQCSEAFYEHCVKEELGTCQSDPESIKKMLEILKRNNMAESEEGSDELDSDDGEPEADLAQRMVNINLDDTDAVWEKLTPEERSEFKKLLRTGGLIDVLPKWEPWWLVRRKRVLVQEVDSKENIDDHKKLSPSVHENVPHLKSLTSVEPSANVPFMLYNVLLSYTFTLQWLKGQHLEMEVEATTMIYKLSANLRNNKVFESFVSAFVAFEDDFKECKWIKSDEESKSTANKDVCLLVEGPCESDPNFYLMASLSDLKVLFQSALKALKVTDNVTSKRFTGVPPKVGELKLVQKKIDYYLSWTLDYGCRLRELLINGQK